MTPLVKNIKSLKLINCPTIIKQEKVDYKLLIAQYLHKYNHTIKPVNRINGKTIDAAKNVVLHTIRFMTTIKVNISIVYVAKNFHVHKCISNKCSYYLKHKGWLSKNLYTDDKYKFHYL